MEKPEIDIYKSLRINRLITLCAVVLASVCICVTVITAFSFASNTMKLTINKLLTIDKTGDVLPMSLVDRDENIKIEISDHLEKWFDRYYSYDFNNVRTKPLRGQWLIASQDFDKLQEKYKEWFKKIEQQKLSQKASLEIDSITVIGNKEPYTFHSSALVTVSDGYDEKYFRLKTSGHIILVDQDYPKNPHGFLITDYKEITEKLEQQ